MPSPSLCHGASVLARAAEPTRAAAVGRLCYGGGPAEAALKLATHLGLNPRLVGLLVSLDDGTATVSLKTVAEMAADDRGLVHGGFVFGAADYAAMAAVNDPNVVLGAADTRFLAPVKVGEVVELLARRAEFKGRKHVVEVTGRVAGIDVFTGIFTTFVLDRHVLEGRDS